MDLKELHDRWSEINLAIYHRSLIPGASRSWAFLRPSAQRCVHRCPEGRGTVPGIFLHYRLAVEIQEKKLGSRFCCIILLYLSGTVITAVIAVTFSMMSDLTVTLSSSEQIDSSESFEQLIGDILLSIISNPVAALINGIYLSILFWTIIIGMLMKSYAKSIIDLVQEASDIMSAILKITIIFAPFGIFGIIYNTISNNSLSIFTQYGTFIVLLLGAMELMMFVVNPLLVFVVIR